MIARELFLEVGGFDESLPIENNDTDLCERVQNQGLKVALAPEAKLIHYESLTRGYSNGEAG